MLKMKKTILSFLLIITIFINSSVTVSATSGGGYVRTDLSGFDNWTLTEKFNYWGYCFEAIVASVCGIVAGDGSALEISLKSLWDELLLEDCTYEEWITTRLGVQQNTESGEYEIVVNDELADLMYSACNVYIEEETGFFVIPTLCASDLDATRFYNKATMDAYKNYINNLGSDICIVGGYWSKYGSSGSDFQTLENGSITTTGIRAYKFYRLKHGYGIICKNPKFNNNVPYLYDYNVYTDEWLQFVQNDECIIDGLSMTQETPLHNTSYMYDAENGDYFIYYSESENPFYGGNYTYYTAHLDGKGIYTSDGRDIRIYRTLDDFKQYSVGQRPYYVTEKFVNYDSTVDNSTTITQTEIDNSISYGDVVTYIINNYENPDGLTEDELRAILEEYLSKIGSGSGGGGSGSGGSSDDEDDGGGSGLSGFLDGLGALGDALLAIIGKLLEYVGKAIELLSGTVTKVIDLVPSTITAILGTIFSFFPQEWMTAIELALVLGVVIGIVGIFKK